MNKRLVAVAGGAVVLLVAGYWGLSAQAGKQAEKRLEDWAYDMELDDKLRWQSVSSSPFGGRVSIHGIELETGRKQPALRVAELVVSDVLQDDERSRIRLQFKGVEADDSAYANLRGIGALAGGDVRRAMHGFEPALSSGLLALKPSDLELYVDIDDNAGTLESELAVDLPELFETRINYQLNNQRGLNKQLSRLQDDLADADNIFQALGLLEEVGQGLQRAEIASVTFTFKDHGMVKRSIALQQRYNTPLDPTAGSADKQRERHYERLVNEMVRNCEGEDIGRSLEDACELMGDLLRGDAKGLELSLRPDKVRLFDLGKVSNDRSAKRLIERLNPKLSSL
ncbi:hypothetical protein EQ836_13575 [Ectopseudomonas mendocina]|uniref:DUF748 domain-containing protein n=1 Tax=Ectopseudomonas mendocina TaxID=300 RepID=A0ABD7S0D7_ECTME|nr:MULTISPECIES: DUF945 domain-containing protein [Pseudomonas]TRO11101.1 hypothetical protein EQ829_19005 [Pseudomonas mendocina]TRO17773.1 hypothetical protein EQ836_13575 [Pseudomonas mendocina]TRO40594.1 hypothetical protein EQ832_07300 [Pseudomonas sp. ALS1131]